MLLFWVKVILACGCMRGALTWTDGMRCVPPTLKGFACGCAAVHGSQVPWVPLDEAFDEVKNTFFVGAKQNGIYAAIPSLAAEVLHGSPHVNTFRNYASYDAMYSMGAGLTFLVYCVRVRHVETLEPGSGHTQPWYRTGLAPMSRFSQAVSPVGQSVA